MKFTQRECSWYKRRLPTPEPIIESFTVDNFIPLAEHYCKINVKYDNGKCVVLDGRVCINDITKKYTINGLSPHGDFILIDVED